MKTKFKNCPAAASVILTTLGCFLLIGCGKEEIKVYSVPKEHFQATPNAAISNNDSGHSSSTPLHWETPAHWNELAPTGIRLGNFLVEEDDQRAEVSIFSFPGNAGSELDNVNRWRGEIGLEPISEKEISPETVSVGGETAQLYDLKGKEFQTIGVILSRNNASWFFKMRGDKEIVSKNKRDLLALLKSVRFHDGDEHNAHKAKDVAATPVTTNVKEVPSKSSSDSPWDVPAGWRETAPTAMVLKNFSAGDAEHEAKISITRFPGDVGGLLANINRWRGQISLEPIGQNDIATLTTSIDVLGGKATLVDMKGPDARLVAAVVPRGGQTWFYKMVGDDATVAREKNAFVKFVQTVRYPNE